MTRTRLLRNVLVLGVSALAAPAALAGSGKCLRADVPLPMILPDGSEHPAGKLTLCVADYSPVASYHKVSVNEIPVGFLFSRRRVPEGTTVEDPVVYFHKTADEKLRLTGYLWPTGRKIFSYLLQGEPWDADVDARVPATEVPFTPARVEELSPGS